jgi:pyruvate dehydrogenase E2 component (dihydrolipoamide acetyltransferase)
MLEFRLPDVGEGIATAEIVEWQVAEGDEVREHQDLVEIQTDKASVTIPCPATGVVARLCAAPGDVLEVGAVLAVIDADGATPAASPDRAAPPAAATLAAPSTRRRARELGVTLDDVEGTGPKGRVLAEDVERAAGQAAAPLGPGGEGAAQTEPLGVSGKGAAPSEPLGVDGEGAAQTEPVGARDDEVIPLRGVRRTIAHTLTRAWQEVPRVIDYREVDATALVRARDSLRRRALERGDEALARALTPTPLLVRGAVLAAREHRYVNASIDLEAERITLHRGYHVGIATAGPDGLTVPVVRDADRRPLADLAREIAALGQAARERRLRPDQLAGPTFTLNNFGSLGAWLGTPIVRPPEVLNVGVGAIRDRVVAVDGAPVVRPTLVLSVAGDHRVLDGDTLAAYVSRLAELLEDPVLLFEDLG